MPHAGLVLLDGTAVDGSQDARPTMDGPAADADSQLPSLDATRYDGALDALEDGQSADALEDASADATLDARDASADAAADGAMDALSDGGGDATLDVLPDRGIDAGPDAAPDGPMDGGEDAESDGATDAMMPPEDAAMDAGADARSDATDASVDVAAEASTLARFRLGSSSELRWAPDAPPSFGVRIDLARCPAGHVVVGADTNLVPVTNVLEGYRLQCAPLTVTGALGPTVAGPSVGMTRVDRSVRCPAGSAAVLGAVRAFVAVDDVQSDCAQVSALLPPSGRESVVGTVRFTNSDGGTEQTLRCPIGSLLVGLDGTLVFLGIVSPIGRVRPVCATIERF